MYDVSRPHAQCQSDNITTLECNYYNNNIQILLPPVSLPGVPDHDTTLGPLPHKWWAAAEWCCRPWIRYCKFRILPPVSSSSSQVIYLHMKETWNTDFYYFFSLAYSWIKCRSAIKHFHLEYMNIKCIVWCVCFVSSQVRQIGFCYG